jgi:cytochrome c peroxidase
MPRPAIVATIVFVAAWLWAGGTEPRDAGTVRDASAEQVAVGRVELGRLIFFDRTLSEPHGTSCASCHDPSLAFSGDHGSGVGVPAGSRPGILARRSTPSLLYLAYVPRFRFFRGDDDRGRPPEPTGGFFWDGRADSIAALVRQPLLNPREMNNGDLAQIAEKLRHAPYAAAFERVFPGALDDPERAAQALGSALEAFLTTPAMAPFSSKYDDYIRGKATLTPQEELGLRLFADRKRGGCIRCHAFFESSPSPERSMFTDYGYDAVGAPRNQKLHAHDDDAGLCERIDDANPTHDTHWCASFRTPSLRNVALRKGFMHNGAFTSLRDVVRFYATRATDPDRWYPSGVAFDDTPPAYRAHVSVGVAPYNGHKGDPPALDDSEVDAIVAFLETLTDRAGLPGSR